MADLTPSDVPLSGTPEWLRTVNDRTALRLLTAHGSLSRSQIRELSGVSKPTASQMVLRLERAGLIEPTGIISGPRGPNAVTYGLRPDSIVGVAMTMEIGLIEAVVVDPTGTEHPIVNVPLQTNPSPVADTLAAVEAACSAADLDPGVCSHVMISVQAAVNHDTDELEFGGTLPGWPTRGARKIIEEATGLTVTLENDANLAAVAERQRLPKEERDDFVFLWLGTGLGAGLDIDGKPRRGATGDAGEVGYLELPLSAASIDGAATNYTEFLTDDALMRMTGAPTYLEALDVLVQDDELLANYAKRLSLLIQPLAGILDPASVILGGPTGTAGGEKLAALTQEEVGSRLSVAATRTGRRAALLGSRTQLLKVLRRELERRIEQSV